MNAAWEYIICLECGGDGWYIGHEAECYERGDCNCSGIQIECEDCQGTGRQSLDIPAALSARKEEA